MLVPPNTINRRLMKEFLERMARFKQVMSLMSSVSFEEKIATGLQLQALTYIKENPHASVGKLAKNLFMSSGAVAQLIERLTNNNWIERTLDSKDRRIVHLTLTKIGDKELKLMQQKRLEMASGILSLISEDDLKEIMRIQDKLLKALEKKQRSHDKTN